MGSSPTKSKRNPSGSARPRVVQPRAAARVVNDLVRATGVHGPFPRDLLPGEWPFPTTNNGAQFCIEYLSAELLSKLDDGLSSERKKSVALEKFFHAEEQCRLTNDFLRRERLSKRFFRPGDGQQIFWSASRKISQLLGKFRWDSAARYFGFGPGASTRLPRRQSAAAFKFSGRPEATPGNMALANAAILLHAPLWNEGLELEAEVGYCKLVPGNRVITVPKNYKTDRVIAIEPCMNMFIQKGLGGVIRRRLKKVGVDLNDQTVNQKLALQGSLDGSLATIDLSMASDTISREVVNQLLPSDWLEALEQCRSPVGVLPSGEVVTYQKFSSMGNGYTFELESLIFWALCEAVREYLGVVDSRVAVYGDDIVVPTAMVEKLLEVLQYSGFTPNMKKSFWQGPFRESCGKHYFLGRDCTPFYIRKPISDISELFKLHNNLYRWASRCSWALSNEERLLFSSIASRLRNLAPREWVRPRIPDGYGDGAFIGTFDACLPRKAPHGLEGFLIKVYSDVSRRWDPDISGRLVASIRTVGTSKISGFNSDFKDVFPEGAVSLPPRTRVIDLLVPRFPGLDPFQAV